MNKTKHFFSHLVDFESVHVELSEMNLNDDERSHLVSVMESSLNHTVMDAILSELSDEDKKIFVKHVALGDHGATWRFLNKKSKNIESKIQEAAHELRKVLHEDIEEAKKKS